MMNSLELEIDRNFDFFCRRIAEYLPNHLGEYALLRHQSVVAFFERPHEAEASGFHRFEDGIFSVQEVTDRPVDLGYMNYAISAGTAC